ncbi:hypothetical protein BB559_003210 [Furculomyces boomerangus]|uniref:Uncharacterized protein n=1 Tax=Furculomyces boomerangus TaxID=61424 RepID=A0A2T9YMR8_9FUNG|nr:hypothetical protein BB559_003210 [Furculomyces boomerangus]
MNFIVEQAIRIAVSFLSFKFIQYYDLDLEINLPYLRTVYILSCVTYFSLASKLYQIVKDLDDQTVLEYPDLKSNDPKAKIQTTNCKYDLKKIDRGMIYNALYILGVGISHWFFGINQLMIIHMFSQVSSLLLTPVMRIHYFGSLPTGDLQRPWKEDTTSGILDSLKYPVETNPPATEFIDEIIKIDKTEAASEAEFDAFKSKEKEEPIPEIKESAKSTAVQESSLRERK